MGKKGFEVKSNNMIKLKKVMDWVKNRESEKRILKKYLENKK